VFGVGRELPAIDLERGQQKPRREQNQAARYLDGDERARGQAASPGRLHRFDAQAPTVKAGKGQQIEQAHGDRERNRKHEPTPRAPDLGCLHSVGKPNDPKWPPKWVGMIALMGLDAETGVFMLLFLDLSHDEAKARGHLRTTGDLVEVIIHGAVKRVRPKAMTVCAAFIGLLRFRTASTSCAHHWPTTA